MLKVENMTIRFGELTAVNSFSMHIPERKIVALIGPNGARQDDVLQLHQRCL